MNHITDSYSVIENILANFAFSSPFIKSHYNFSIGDRKNLRETNFPVVGHIKNKRPRPPHL